ncbi:BlaI/MecI/CopY family transcriptional regulator [Longispora sp. K20-0274]|uniref:BlaI/MecI/CopY family transcriptional regulator n=1 Tax=Longispora sp. K20-0274 TaxID=3088255 RepID=UPI00399AA981
MLGGVVVADTGQGGRRAPGTLESEVLGVLWAADGALSPAEVQTSLGTGLAYNTVHTVLSRLVDKGLVSKDTRAGRSLYAPVLDSAELAADRMRTALVAGGDAGRVLHRFVTGLSAEEARALRAALGEGAP